MMEGVNIERIIFEIFAVGGAILASVGMVYRTWIKPQAERAQNMTLKIAENSEHIKTLFNALERHEQECQRRLAKSDKKFDLLFGKMDELQKDMKDLSVQIAKINK